MRKSESTNNKDKHTNKDKENSKNSFNNINLFLRLLVFAKSYLIIIILLSLFFKGANISEKAVLSQALGVNMVLLVITIYHIYKK